MSPFANQSMTRAMSKETFKTCKMTCDGGSECGTCPCERPTECKLVNEPGFPEERRTSIRKMIAWAALPLEERKKRLQLKREEARRRRLH